MGADRGAGGPGEWWEMIPMITTVTWDPNVTESAAGAPSEQGNGGREG